MNPYFLIFNNQHTSYYRRKFSIWSQIIWGKKCSLFVPLSEFGFVYYYYNNLSLIFLWLFIVIILGSYSSTLCAILYYTILLKMEVYNFCECLVGQGFTYLSTNLTKFESGWTNSPDAKTIMQIMLILGIRNIAVHGPFESFFQLAKALSSTVNK